MANGQHLLILCLALSVVCVAVATKDPPKGAKYVQAVIDWDNEYKEVKPNLKTIGKYVAEKLCSINSKNVTFVGGKDTSKGLNEASQTAFRCYGVFSKLEDIMDDCEDKLNRSAFDDEVQDHTTPDNEYTKIVCTYGA